MPGWEVTYNGVRLKEVETKRFDQSIEYDESGTDMLYHRFVVRVAGSVHADSIYFHGAEVGNDSWGTATEAMLAVRTRLLQPRAEFLMSVGGSVLLIASADRKEAYCDRNNGPKPRDVSITQIAGRSLFRVEFEIEICTITCADPGIQQQTYGAGSNPSVLNNRWSISEEKDREFFTTRTISGLLRVSHISHWPHLFRYLCVPPLQRGYRRETQKFTDSPDGLTLRYEIVDRQKHAAPPSPAVDWRGAYTESTATGGAVGFGELRLEMTGAPGSPKFALLEAAVAVLFQRLGDLRKSYEAAGDGDHSILLKHLAITEHLDVNKIELNARVQHTATEQRILNARVAKIGTPLDLDGYDPKRWPVPKLYDGSSPSGIFAKYLQSPCVNVHGIVGMAQADPQEVQSGQEEDDQGEPEFFQDSEPINQDDDSGVNQEQRRGGFPYTYYTIENRYETAGGIVQLPIARINTAGATDDTAALIPLHNGVTRRIVVIHGERVGDWPRFPAPRSIDDPNGIALAVGHVVIVPEAPELTADGKTRLFKAQARYELLMARPPRVTELFAAGADPREEGEPADNAMPGSTVFVEGIL